MSLSLLAIVVVRLAAAIVLVCPRRRVDILDHRRFRFPVLLCHPPSFDFLEFPQRARLVKGALLTVAFCLLAFGFGTRVVESLGFLMTIGKGFTSCCGVRIVHAGALRSCFAVQHATSIANRVPSSEQYVKLFFLFRI